MSNSSGDISESPWVMALVILGVFLIGLIFGCIIADNPQPVRSYLLDPNGRVQWEVLVTGFGAVLAATVTIRKISQQIEQARLIEADRLRRRERAARAALPMALVEFTDYIKVVISTLSELRECRLGNYEIDHKRAAQIIEGKGLRIPKLSNGVLPVLKECAEFASGRAANEFMIIIKDFQIQHSRMAEILSRLSVGQIVIWSALEANVALAAELLVRASDLFAYARLKKLRKDSINKYDIDKALIDTEWMYDADTIAANWETTYSKESDALSSFIQARFDDDVGEGR